MSRNLCETFCYFCRGEVRLVEDSRRGDVRDFGRYVEQYAGMTVANAVCIDCEAKYLAWIDERPRTSTSYHESDRWADEHTVPPFVDLSFRSTFNDEPGPDDMPRFEIEVRVTRTRKPVAQHACGLALMRDTDGELPTWCTECRAEIEPASIVIPPDADESLERQLALEA